MDGKYTFTIIKPNAVSEKQEGKIIDIILNKGFEIVRLQRHTFTKAEAEAFYDVHKDKYFFNDLVTYMCSGPIYIAVLEAEDCVKKYRKVIGKTDPREAAMGTIRKLYGKTLRQNAVHGSDSDASAIKEIKLFFPEILNN